MINFKEMMIEKSKYIDLNHISLTKFINLNKEILQEMEEKKIHKTIQVKIISEILNRDISLNSYCVAISRNKENKKKEFSEFVIVERDKGRRFVDKNAILTLGGQVERIQKVNSEKIEERLIDWRGLHKGESVSSWVLEYKRQLQGLNKTGWRWSQIADAVSEHLKLKKKIHKNTITSFMTIYKNK